MYRIQIYRSLTFFSTVIIIIIIFYFFLLIRFDRQWLLAVETFLYRTVSLVKRILYPCKDQKSIKRAKESIKRKTKKKTGKDKELDERCEPAESVYQNLFVTFGELFFLKDRSVYMHSCKFL